jgi:hypothetical protein
MIALTFGYSDYSVGGYGPFPDMTVRSLLCQNAAYLRFHTPDSSDTVQTLPPTEEGGLDLLSYYTSIDAYHLLVLGWFFGSRRS